MFFKRKIKVLNYFDHNPDGRIDGAFLCNYVLRLIAIKGKPVVIDLNDNEIGYGSQFLEEAFGGLIRRSGISLQEFHRIFEIKHKHKFYEEVIAGYVAAAYYAAKHSQKPDKD